MSRAIIERDGSSSVLGNGGVGHQPGLSYASACGASNDGIVDLQTNGVAFAASPTIAIDASAEQTLICPACESRHDAPEELWSALGAWYEGGPSAVACGSCHTAIPLREWCGDPPFAVGHLAITFWNWPPLSMEFIREIEALLGHEFVLVNGKL